MWDCADASFAYITEAKKSIDRYERTDYRLNLTWGFFLLPVLTRPALCSLIASLDVASVVFRGFGKEVFKSFRLSPDACFQLVLQVTPPRSQSPSFLCC